MKDSKDEDYQIRLDNVKERKLMLKQWLSIYIMTSVVTDIAVVLYNFNLYWESEIENSWNKLSREKLAQKST